jgi:hypothetical protein
VLSGVEEELPGAVAVAAEVDGVDEEWPEDDEPANAFTATANTTSTTTPATTRRRMIVAWSGGVRRRDTGGEEGELMASSEGSPTRTRGGNHGAGDASAPAEKPQHAIARTGRFASRTRHQVVVAGAGSA